MGLASNEVCIKNPFIVWVWVIERLA